MTCCAGDCSHFEERGQERGSGDGSTDVGCLEGSALRGSSASDIAGEAGCH